MDVSSSNTLDSDLEAGKRWNREAPATTIKGREKTSMPLHVLKLTFTNDDVEWIKYVPRLTQTDYSAI